LLSMACGKSSLHNLIWQGSLFAMCRKTGTFYNRSRYSMRWWGRSFAFSLVEFVGKIISRWWLVVSRWYLVFMVLGLPQAG